MTEVLYDFEEKFWATRIPANVCKHCHGVNIGERIPAAPHWRKSR